jgi:hypothetical protein
MLIHKLDLKSDQHCRISHPQRIYASVRVSDLLGFDGHGSRVALFQGKA